MAIFPSRQYPLRQQRRKQVKPERSLDELDAPDAARIVLRDFRAKLTAEQPPPTPAQERKEVGFSESCVGGSANPPLSHRLHDTHYNLLQPLVSAQTHARIHSI